jgi:dynein heavy chain
VTVISAEVGKKAKECDEDLRRAMPALEAAQKALDTLDKNSLTEMKSFANPPSGVMLVSAAVICLMAPGGKVPKDKSWKAAKVMMGNVDKFLSDLKNYDKDNIHENCRREVKPYLNDSSFTPELIRTQSQAAAGLCSWVINILKYYEVYMDVLPKKLALEKANAELQAARDKLAIVEKKVTDLEAKLKILTNQFEEAVEAKVKCEKEAAATSYTINLANRLVGGLSSENVRWSQSVQSFKEEEVSLPGNVLLITAFISYIGCFTKNYRHELMKKWVSLLKHLRVCLINLRILDFYSFTLFYQIKH